MAAGLSSGFPVEFPAAGLAIVFFATGLTLELAARFCVVFAAAAAFEVALVVPGLLARAFG